METWYGTWTTGTVIHIMGYDGKYLCGRKQSNEACECGIHPSEASCKKCLKELKRLSPALVPTYADVKALKSALEHCQGIVDLIDGKPDAKCAVKGEIPKGLKIFITTWIIPKIERTLEKYGDDWRERLEKEE